MEPEEEPTDRGAMVGAGDASTGVPSTAPDTQHGVVPIVPDLPPLAKEADSSQKPATSASSTGPSPAAAWLGPQTPREQERERIKERRRGIERQVDLKRQEVFEVSERVKAADEVAAAQLSDLEK